MAREMPQLTGVRHRFVNAGGLKTHVAVAGRGEPVILLHGWPQHWYAWRSLIPLLAERYRVYCPDLRGFGWTDIAWTGFEKENMADDVVNLLDALELERVRIVGHDWGAWIGFLLALRHPERVEQLVALNCPPPWSRITPRTVLAARRLHHVVTMALPYVGRLLLERRPAYVRRLIRRWAHDTSAWTKEDFRIFSRDLRSPTRARASSLLYRTFLVRELLPVVFGRYRKARLETPTLLMHGRKDGAVGASLLAGADRRAERLELELVPNAGHFLPEERPEHVAERALAFFGGDGRAA